MDEHGKESGNLILTVEASHFRQDLDEKNRKLPDPKRTKAKRDSYPLVNIQKAMENHHL